MKKELKVGLCVIGGLFVFFVLLLAMIPSDTSSTNTERIGSPLVYDRIDVTIDCNELQEGFDRSMDYWEMNRQRGNSHLSKVSSSYADYYHARMREVGCYD